jgi:hypothetical protein
MSFNTPVLFLTYKRYRTAIRVFNTIKKIKPNKLYFASNAPKNESEIKAVQKVRDICKKINWKCKLTTIFYSKHMLVKDSIPASINFFFKKEKQGIILEDDVLPSQSFYFFCQKMLKIFKNKKKISCIYGSSFLKKRGKSNIYFSKYTHIWGWATWRSRWKNYDPYIKFWPKFKKSKIFKNLNSNVYEYNYWNNIYDKTYLRKLNTWDYAWQACTWYKNQLSIAPSISLTQNIGYDLNAEHTIRRYKFIKKKTQNKINFYIPKKIIRNIKNDWFDFKYHYRSGYLTAPERTVYYLNNFFKDPFIFLIKLKKMLKYLFKKKFSN